MADVKRNPVEMEIDRAYIAGILQQAGPDVSSVQVCRLLNRHREARARAAGIDAGKTAEEIEEMVQFARLTVWSVRRDMNALKARAQEAALVGAALFLDDQISAVRDEIQQTHDMDEAILLDLETSRGEQWTRTREKRVGGDEGGIAPTETLRQVKDSAASAALYGRLQENARRRGELRAEERLLRFGRQSAPAPTVEEEQTFTELVMDMGDPIKARGAALQLLRREIQDLETASRAPLAGDMLRLETMRVQQIEARIKSLRDFIQLPDNDDGKSKTFEISFEVIPMKQITATSEGGIEE